MDAPITAFARSATSRHFRLTIYDEELLPVADQMGIRYFVYQKEICPTTARVHWQTYIQYRREKRVTTVRRRFPATDVRIANAPKGARLYCMKEDTRAAGALPVEWGEFRSQGSNDITSLIRNVQKGKRKRDLLETHGPAMVRHRHAFDDIALLTKPKLRPRVVALFIGASGTGKTRYCFDNWPDHYANPLSKELWMDGYDNEDVVLLDDYKGHYPLDKLLRLLHEYPEKAPVKGSFTWWNPKLIIITSNHPTDKWYDFTGREEHEVALNRRINLTYSFPLAEHEDPKQELADLYELFEDMREPPVQPQAEDNPEPTDEELDRRMTGDNPPEGR